MIRLSLKIFAVVANSSKEVVSAKLLNHITFAGPDPRKLAKTAEIADFDNSGEVPPHGVRELTVAKMRRAFTPVSVAKKTYKIFECVIFDMIGKFIVPSEQGAIFSHNAVEHELNLRFVYPVRRANAETFIEVLAALLVFIEQTPNEMVFRIFRADAGSVYTSEKVRSWLKARGIKAQYANVETPHQIAIAERNHGILLSMMRAMMALSHAPKSMWAAALIYAAFLCNHMASEYKVNATAQIPYMSLGMTYMREFMFPFGCLVWIHRSKQKVEDGKLDVRANYAIYIGVGMTQGVKGIKVLTSSGHIETSIHYGVDKTYFPWRPE